MRIEGNQLDGLEYGNAWDLLDQPDAPTNWIVGETPYISQKSLRFMQRDNADTGAKASRAKNICVNWFIHDPADPKEWGQSKPTSAGRTISILVGYGQLELEFSRDDEKCILLLENSGDFAIWGPGLDHSWRALKPSTVVTIRWEPIE